MGRKHVICHERTTDEAPDCGAVFSADDERVLLEMAVRHGINVHGHANTESYREEVRSRFRDGNPPS